MSILNIKYSDCKYNCIGVRVPQYIMYRGGRHLYFTKFY